MLTGVLPSPLCQPSNVSRRFISLPRPFLAGGKLAALGFGFGDVPSLRSSRIYFSLFHSYDENATSVIGHAKLLSQLLGVVGNNGTEGMNSVTRRDVPNKQIMHFHSRYSGYKVVVNSGPRHGNREPLLKHKKGEREPLVRAPVPHETTTPLPRRRPLPPGAPDEEPGSPRRRRWLRESPACSSDPTGSR